MLTKSSKSKGRRLQNLVSKAINETLHWEVRPAIMGEKGSDIKGEIHGWDIECKNNEKISIWEAWKQVDERCSNSQPSPVPLLIMSKNRQKQPLAIMELRMLLVLLSEFYRGTNEKKSENL